MGLIRTVVSLLACGALEAQTGALSGRVLDALSGQPLDGATVSISGSVIRSARTGHTGAFRFEGLPGGDYELTARAEGYAGDNYSGYLGEGIRLAEGASEERILRLEPTGTLSGEVLDASDQPVEGVELYASRRGPSGELGPAIHTVSAKDGSYRFEGLAAGEYLIRYRLPFVFRKRSVEQRDGETVGYPNFATLPGTVRAMPGVEAGGGRIRLARKRLVALSGKVIDGATGEPLREGWVELLPKGIRVLDEAYGKRAPGRGGEFAFELLEEGEYSLLVYRAGSRGSLPYVTPVVVGANGTGGWQVVAPPFVTIDGVAKGPGKDRLTVQLMNGIALESAKVGGDGRFRLEDVPPGTWRVMIGGGVVASGLPLPSLPKAMVAALPKPVFTRAIRFGETDALQGLIVVTEGANPALEIETSDEAVTLRGEVVDDRGEPVAGAQVEVETPAGVRRLRARAGGRFQLEALPPGRYVLKAEAPGFGTRCDATPVTVTATVAGEALVRLVACKP